MSRLRPSFPFLVAGLLIGVASSVWSLDGPRVEPRAAEPQKAEAPAKAPDRPTLKTHSGSFDGVIGRTIEESRASWPAPLRARPGSPNVVYIVLDDVGFGQIGCFGGPVSTPNIDKLAKNGLRYNNFHTTALCSPTRSCFLTGRNHQSNHMACITEGSTGFPGSDGQIPKENGFLSEILVRAGYSAFAVGKWHLTPDEETNMAARKDRWPLGRGFERFYGFLGGETHQYYPELVYDNHSVDPPSTPEQGYHLSVDLTNRAIEFVRDQKAVAPDKPFFLYYALGAAHAPHHAPKDWIAKYKGKFDQGWDKLRDETLARQKEMGIVPETTQLPPRNAEVKAWESYGRDERRLFSRFMEVFAGFLSHADDQIGRLIAQLEATGEFDNTLIYVVSDNGASAEGGEIGSANENIFFNALPESLADNLKKIDDLGGPLAYNHYPFGWTMAGNTPFKKWKRETHLGGIRDPLIVHWPKGIKAKGEIRNQYAHAIDLVPTALEVCGVEPPASINGVTQSPIEGVSFAQTFNDPKAKSRHETQYYEMFGYRAIYHDGWTAVSPHLPFGTPLTEAILQGKTWELYHSHVDFSQAEDVAWKYPEKVKEMDERWWVEAGKYHVLPLDGRGQQRMGDPRPQLTPDRDHFEYGPGMLVPQTVAVRTIGRSHSIAAEVEIPPSGAEGVLLAHGSRFGGFAFFVKEKKLNYAYNYVGLDQFMISTNATIPAGSSTLRVDVTMVRPHEGRAELFIDGKLVGEGPIPRMVPITFGLQGGLSCGFGSSPAVSDTFKAPFSFTGTLKKVSVDLR
jgi:arylsulfatase A-like enzyme